MATFKEERFLTEFAKTGDRLKAEKKAGFLPGGGYRLLARPEVKREIIAAQEARLTTDALPIAVRTLIEIMQNAKAPAAARVQASKVVLDRALPLAADGRSKEIHELTPAELAQAIHDMETAASAMARDVTVHTLEAPEQGIFD